jgi:hypothetical protein
MCIVTRLMVIVEVTPSVTPAQDLVQLNVIRSPYFCQVQHAILKEI